MVRACVFPNCTSKMARWATVSFHRLPFHNLDLLKIWLVVLELDPNSTVEALRRADHRVCSAHFDAEDFFPQKPRTEEEEQKRQRMNLMKNAIPKITEMPRTCVYPGCSNKHTSWTPYRFHRIPYRDIGLRKLWLAAMKMDINLPTAALKKHVVCSAHFTEQDYLQDTHRLKSSAVPVIQIKEKVERFNSTGTQVPETCTEDIKTLSLHHIVEEEAILQLMRNCPLCNRNCRCSKRINGAYLIIYQNCYFCQYSRKWTNQPGATDITVQKAKKPVKRKRQPKPKKKEPEKAEAEPVKEEEEEFAVSEWLAPL